MQWNAQSIVRYVPGALMLSALLGSLLHFGVVVAANAEGVAVSSSSDAKASDSKETKGASKSSKRLERAKHETAVYVTRMHCSNCAKKIARKLYALKGVTKVQADVKENLTVVTPKPEHSLDPQTVWKAVASSGFKPKRLVGPQGTFEADDEGNPVKSTADSDADSATAESGSLVR